MPDGPAAAEERNAELGHHVRHDAEADDSQQGRRDDPGDVVLVAEDVAVGRAGGQDADAVHRGGGRDGGDCGDCDRHRSGDCGRGRTRSASDGHCC